MAILDVIIIPVVNISACYPVITYMKQYGVVLNAFNKERLFQL